MKRWQRALQDNYGTPTIELVSCAHALFLNEFCKFILDPCNALIGALLVDICHHNRTFEIAK